MKREPWNPLLKSFPESRKINSMSLGAETMFIRLLALCDDHANYYGDPRLLLAYAYGQRLANGTASVRKCTRWRDELVTANLVEPYEVDGHQYLHVINCKKMLRSDIKEDIRFPVPPEKLGKLGEKSEIRPRTPPRTNKKQGPCENRDSPKTSIEGQKPRESTKNPTGSVTNPARTYNEPGSSSVSVESSVDSSTSTKKTPAAAPPSVGGFEEFYAAYPRQIAKVVARRAWIKAKDKPPLDAILKAVEAQKASEQWTKDGGQFIPHPATWLNQERWNDEVEPGSAKGQERIRLDTERAAREVQYAAFAKIKVGDKASGPEGAGVVGNVCGTSIRVKVDGYGWVEIRDMETLGQWTFSPPA